eukprot:TRINITY_DN31930_c0_g1_i1.p1 TRINITY_DN31930_c0_g1~~TRINITY_DN31930_c0_g1_i1.p1  ORF type:complete len:474 (+),score=69.99 TRINITY_DN31930_c0_g1_i1:73-1494(+)
MAPKAFFSLVFLGCIIVASCVCPGQYYGTPPSDEAEVPDAATYDKALKALDLAAVVADLKELMVASQECWPADYGHYGPFFIRLAWHCSGTYRSGDKRGGCGGGRQRFEPERSWPDNTNLDKARALLWPVKEKYGVGLSWGDLFTLAGTVAINSMGGPLTEFCVGRIDSPNGAESMILGPSAEQERVSPCKINGLCETPLGASTVGLIYVNPEGPVAQNADGTWTPDPDPVRSAADVRNVFSRMGLDDEETVALIGGGHAFGKSHGACPAGAGLPPSQNVTNPWIGLCGTGNGKDTFTSGFEGPWTTNPIKWDNEYFVNLRKYEWEKYIGPGGHWQWRPSGANGADAQTLRLTSDVALLHDRKYAHIVKEFAEHQHKLDKAFDRAWHELVHHGGYWSKERKCLSGKKSLGMLGDDVELEETVGVDAASSSTFMLAAIVLGVSGSFVAVSVALLSMRGRASRLLDDYDTLNDQM